jgi:hypothetical protein
MGRLRRNSMRPARATMISVEPPPMSMTTVVPWASSGNERSAARKVSAASRSPSMTSTGRRGCGRRGRESRARWARGAGLRCRWREWLAPCCACDGRVVGQHGQRALDAGPAEATVGADAAAEARDLRALGQHAHVAVADLGDQQQGRVGADIDGGEAHGLPGLGGRRAPGRVLGAALVDLELAWVCRFIRNRPPRLEE